MGVYIFRSLHDNFIKVGHYAGQNAWSRVAHRGFYSCVCPNSIQDKVSVTDLELMAWFPGLGKKDEALVKKKWKMFRVYGKSEWFPADILNEIQEHLCSLDQESSQTCNLEEALSTRRRL